MNIIKISRVPGYLVTHERRLAILWRFYLWTFWRKNCSKRILSEDGISKQDDRNLYLQEFKKEISWWSEYKYFFEKDRN